MFPLYDVIVYQSRHIQFFRNLQRATLISLWLKYIYQKLYVCHMLSSLQNVAHLVVIVVVVVVAVAAAAAVTN